MMVRCLKVNLSLGLLWSWVTIALAQSLGTPYISNYTPLEYGAEGQNWAIAQDQIGLMYFGNNDGILEYDGVTWRLIETERKTVVRSLAVDDNNTVFVGAYGEIGYLTPDSLGQLTYVSLLPLIDTNYYDFGDVWQTAVADDAVYFCTQKYLFRFSDRNFKIWKTPTYFLHMAIIDDEVYIRQWEFGLMRMESDSLVLLPEGEQFSLPIIASILPFSDGDKDQLLICTQKSGLYLYDGVKASPFYTNFDSQLADARIYKVVKLNDLYVFTTIHAGIFIMDQTGRILDHIDEKSGLQNNTVWSAYQDNQQGLWVALDAGLSRVEVVGPIRHFDNEQGLEGTVLDILRHDHKLYVATSRGVFILNETEKQFSTFTAIEGLPPQCFDLLSFGKVLLVATLQGVFEINDNRIREVTKSYSFSITGSSQDTNRIYIGLQTGLMSIYFNHGEWVEEEMIGDFDLEIREMLETQDGKLWATTRQRGILRIDYSDGFGDDANITHFDTSYGLPVSEFVTATNTSFGLRFLTSRGIFQFVELTGQFHPDTLLIPDLPNQEATLKYASRDLDDNLWLLPDKGLKLGVARKRDETYIWDDRPLLRARTKDFIVIYPDSRDSGIIWFGGTERMLRFDDSVPVEYERDFKTVIRNVRVNNDSLVYGGSHGTQEGDEVRLPILNYNQNSLRFSFASLSYDGESENVYQYKLEGYDDNWSGWSTESWKDYTNLREGDYRFLVRGKNLYQHIGEVAIVRFRVRPPVYRTWWAFLSYGLILMGVLYGLRRRELNRIHRRHQMEMQRMEFHKLKELDKLKTNFFTDISHEFRTPLSLIIGPVDNLIKKYPKGEDIREFQMVRRNAERLLRMINQMLELSRLEADKIQLDLKSDNLLPLIKGITASFELMAENKGISISYESIEEEARVNYDREKIEQVFINLISNALKFTPAGGKVSVRANISDENDWLLVSVSDTGAGMAEKDLPHIFDRFYQAEGSTSRSSVGSGIGLALSKKMTEMHHGRIGVSSTIGKGTQFLVKLPLCRQPAISADSRQLKSEFENTILLVEDNPDMRIFIRETLSSSFNIIEAEDGQQGVEMAIEHTPDLILSDVMMPRMDGLELCSAVKKDDRTSHIPLILLTAKSSISSRIEGLEQGADDYLGKPFHQEELLLRIQNLFEWRKSLQKKYANLQSEQPVVDRSVSVQVEFLKKTKEFVETHLKDNELSIEGIAQSVNMSRSQFFRKVKALTGQSPSVFIRNIRLDVGKNLLETTEMNVSEVAYEVGFSTPTYFSDAFKNQYGIRPSQVKK